MRHRLAAALLTAATLAAPCALAQPSGGFKHIVIVVQENRTPDNLFGSNPTFEPGVDIAKSGVNSHGAAIPLSAVPLAVCYDINHTHKAFLAMFDDGRMDGADQENATATRRCGLPANPQFKFADNASGQVQPYFDIASQYGFANRMFQTQQGPSFPAHQFIFGGTSAPDDRSTLFAAENPPANKLGVGCTADPKQHVKLIDPQGREHGRGIYPCLDRATMADLLDAAGVSWTYYSNVSGKDTKIEGLWNAPAAINRLCQASKRGRGGQCTGGDYVRHVDTTQAKILRDITACALPSVSWVVPDARDSDHARVNGGTGPSWVASIVNAIGQQQACRGGETYWNDTAILITWDDWGGWYDHVPPFKTGGQANGWGRGYTYGFRVPLMVVSAYTAAHTVDNANHDFGSTLAFVERNFGLGRIGGGNFADAYADTLDGFFNLTAPRSFAPIGAQLPAAYFLTATRSAEPPDDD